MQRRRLGNSNLVIATKFGSGPDANGIVAPSVLNSKPEHIKQVAEASLKRLVGQ